MVKKTGRRSYKKLVSLVLAIVLLAIGIILCLHYHPHKPAITQPLTIKGAPSQPTQHQATTNVQLSPGGVVDKNGQATSSLPPSSEWASSNSGNIILQLPTANSSIKSGNVITGLAKVNTVQFILKDSSVGQIAQGSLNVVNGKFSGYLQFTSHSATGELEVFSPNPNSGAEENIININVNF